jgi:hypothetical protein
MKSDRSIADVLEKLEAQAAFHEEREAFHTGREEHHREQRSEHAARLEDIRRRLEAFRAAAAEALDVAEEPPVQAAARQEADLGSASRPRLGRMVELIPVTLGEELNQHFSNRLRVPVDAGQVSVVLRRLCRMGRIHQVRRGRPHWEALYVREAPEERT